MKPAFLKLLSLIAVSVAVQSQPVVAQTPLPCPGRGCPDVFNRPAGDAKQDADEKGFKAILTKERKEKEAKEKEAKEKEAKEKQVKKAVEREKKAAREFDFERGDARTATKKNSGS